MTTLAAISLSAPTMAMGAGLMVLPIAAHLLNRKARRRVIFPSIELLVSVSANQSKFFKLRRWWLLLLRCLAVLAIVAAFMQPMWLSAGAQRAAGRGGAVVMVIDTSASTGQLHGGVPAIQSMRAKADHVLDTLVPGSEHANIIYAAARPYSIFASMTTHIDALRSGLIDIEPTHERADLIGALSLAGRMLSDYAGPRRLVIVSDMQESNWSDAIDSLRRDATISAGTRVTVLTPNGTSPANLSLHRPSVRPAAPRIGQPFSLAVTLTNHSDRVQPASVRVTIDGRPFASKPLTINPRQQIEVAFSTTFDKPGEHRVIYSIPGDAMAVDDDCYQLVRVVQQTPVILLTDDDVNGPGSAGYFMARSLAPYGDARDRYDVRLVRSTDPFPFTIGDTAVVFVGRAGLLGDNQVKALLQHIERGGGVVFFYGDAPALMNLEVLGRLKPNAILPWHPVAPQAQERTGQPLTLTGGDWRSPLLARFDEAARLSLAQIQVRQAWSGGPIDQNAQALLSYADGTPALVWREVGAGKLAIANFSADQSHSDLGKHGLFVALMQGLADELQTAHQPSDSNLVGRAANLMTSVPIDRRGPAPLVYQPDGRTPVEATLDLGDHNSRMVLSEPSKPGFYTAQQGDTILGTVAINIDPRESDLRSMNADVLTSALKANAGDAAVEASSVTPGLTYHAKGLWGWLLVFACVLLGSEMFLLGYWRR